MNSFLKNPTYSIRRFLAFCYFGLVSSLPVVSSAEDTTKPGDDVEFSFSIDSLLRFESVDDLVVGVLNVLIVFATPIIVLFIIYAGFLYVTARGNPQQIETANRAIVYAIIGAVMVIGAMALATILEGTITALAS